MAIKIFFEDKSIRNSLQLPPSCFFVGDFSGSFSSGLLFSGDLGFTVGFFSLKAVRLRDKVGVRIKSFLSFVHRIPKLFGRILKPIQSHSCHGLLQTLPNLICVLEQVHWDRTLMNTIPMFYK